MKNATHHEIVHVVQPDFLVNASRIACRYETADRQPLAPGYYFALWPPGATARSFDRRVRYFGPFATNEEAALVQDCAEYLQLVAPATAAPCGKAAARLTPAVRAAYDTLLQVLRDRATPRLKRCGAQR